jgi:uncharacterized protein YjbI with pentapeptide repeats
MHLIKNELKQNYSSNVESVWFDSWRYEREKYSAMVPLLRTIILTINDKLEKITNSAAQDKKKQVLSKLKTTFTKVGSAILRNTSANVGVNAGEALEAGATFDIGKMIDDYKSDGSFIIDQERVYFHKHISEHLNDEFHKIRYDENGRLIYDFRLIIFIDDLDRCTPERALEILESIKTFFDIEGIIYVIGMDPRTIDPIIRTKYGEDMKIDGMDYLQKIVQLPFQIPVWNSKDISTTIRDMITKTGMPESEIKYILEGTNIELIIRAAQLNPRDVKRFINTLILSKVIYGQSSKDFEKLIAIQAFYFRGTKWIDFLKLIIPYYTRIEFLKSFIISSESGNLSSLEDLSKSVDDVTDKKGNSRLQEPLGEIWEKLIELNDSDLFFFLKISASTLIKIDVIEKYLRAEDTIEVKDSNQTSSETNKLVELLRNENVNEFNKTRDQSSILIHLPYENMGYEYDQGKIRKFELSKINLRQAFLFRSDFSGANLLGADLSDADLSAVNMQGTDLSGAILQGADLSGANLQGADLSGANLQGADLSGANLQGADLSGANLQGTILKGTILKGADLSGAGLRRAYLSGADLREAYLFKTDLSRTDLSEIRLQKARLDGADLSGAKLQGGNLVGAILSGANLSRTILSDTDLSWADLSMATLKGIDMFANLKLNNANFDKATIDNELFINYLREEKNGAKNVPEGTGVLPAHNDH